MRLSLPKSRRAVQASTRRRQPANRQQPVQRRRARSTATRQRANSPAQGARARLQQFRQASIVAVALTGLLLLFFAPDEVGLLDSFVAPEAAAVPTPAAEPPAPGQATEEATETLRNMWTGFFDNLPRYLIALSILILAWALARLLRPLLRRALGQWERADAITALTGAAIWLLAIGVATSILVGDIRALVGSLGLVGLALSWALQTPIESFTGWLLNSFQGYYRVGDRIAVGDVFGDVYRIDFLTTTVWEYGGPDYPAGLVQAEQPTGRLITLPNSAVLTGTVINYTRDFPYVWDELTVSVAHESDVSYTAAVLQKVADELLGNYMNEPAQRYEHILKKAGLEPSVPDRPQVFVLMADPGADLTIRYLVAARERRRWKSDLSTRLLKELSRSEHAGKILPVYQREQLQFLDKNNLPAQAQWLEKPTSEP